VAEEYKFKKSSKLSLYSPSSTKKTTKTNYEYHTSEHLKCMSSASSTNSCSSQNSPVSNSPRLYSPNLNAESSNLNKINHKRKNSSEGESNIKSEKNIKDELKLKSFESENYRAHLDDSEQTSMTKAKIEACKGDVDLNDIECYLETDELWKKFHELGTEMIITKSGRRMFPPLRVSFGGAKLNQKYIIAMDIVPTDSKRYRYAYHRSSWQIAGKADPPVQSRLFIHPDGPFTGESLYKQIVSFEKVKLTNNEMDKCGHVSWSFLA
jgi:hypothetical protein